MFIDIFAEMKTGQNTEVDNTTVNGARPTEISASKCESRDPLFENHLCHSNTHTHTFTCICRMGGGGFNSRKGHPKDYNNLTLCLLA